MDYNKLVEKKESLIAKRNSFLQDISEKRNQINQIKSEIDSLGGSLSSSIDRSKKEALKQEIDKATKPVEDEIEDLTSKRETLLSNKQRRLDSLNYDVYASKIKDSISIDSCLEKCKSIYELLENKQGKRLNDLLFKTIPPSEISLKSLSDIEDTFGYIDWKLQILSKKLNLLDKMQDFIFSLSLDVSDQKQLLLVSISMFIVVAGVIWFSPLMVIVMIGIIAYNVYSCNFICECISILNSISSNLEDIKSSIEEGIKSKIEEDRTTIETRFSSKLSKIDNYLDDLENKVLSITKNVEKDFSYDSTRLQESFRIKESSLNSKITGLRNIIDSLNESCNELDIEIKHVDNEIMELSKNIYKKYYPTDLSNKSVFYPNDILLDIVNNEPIISTLPTDSSLIVFRNEDEMFSFVNLLLPLLYSNMKCSSFKLQYYDIKYVGSKSISYKNLGNLEVITNKEDLDKLIEELLPELDKRFNILIERNITEYNKEMLLEKSVPLGYNVLFDFGLDSQKYSVSYKQLLKVGFKLGLVFFSFVCMDEIDMTGRGPFWEVLKIYNSIYVLTPNGLSKKTPEFFSSRIKK